MDQTIRHKNKASIASGMNDIFTRNSSYCCSAS